MRVSKHSCARAALWRRGKQNTPVRQCGLTQLSGLSCVSTGTKHGDGLARELEAARNAAQQDAKMKRARHLQKETSAEKRAVAVEDAYSMPNGDSRRSARGGGAWANKLQKVAQ